MRWQRHQLDHTQIIRTSLQTDNRASTSLLRADNGSWVSGSWVRWFNQSGRVTQVIGQIPVTR